MNQPPNRIANAKITNVTNTTRRRIASLTARRDIAITRRGDVFKKSGTASASTCDTT